MSEQSDRGLDDLDPAQFVGEAPAGDASPGDFVSTDQSDHHAHDHHGPDDPDNPDDPDTQEDA